MIIEGIITTLDPDQQVHIAAMGPIVDSEMQHLVLRPFRTAQTYRNLKAHPEGVFHISDDVLLLARAALGPVVPAPALQAAGGVRGFILADACRYYEFRVRSIDEREERSRMDAEVLHSGRLRDFLGFNRAKHAVLEAAILATRTEFLPLAEIESEFRKLRVIVDKTGGEQEKAAFAFLQEHLDQVVRARSSAKERVS
jgi:hypothetical protein